jgi:hypothetical protein
MDRLKKAKQVRMANNVNNIKLGSRCKEGLGRPMRPNAHESDKFAELYLKDYEKENAYGCSGYMMYDFENSQYCCSARPRTAVEMMDFIFMMLEVVLKTNGKAHLRMIGYYFDRLFKKVPEELKDYITKRYESYVHIIDEQYDDFKKHKDEPLRADEQRFMDEFEEQERQKESTANANYEKQQNFLKSQKQ